MSSSDSIKNKIVTVLDDNKAENIVTIPLKNKSEIADYLIIASGLSGRHLVALASHVSEAFKQISDAKPLIEGEGTDWLILDTGDIILHLFREETRQFYNLEKMWDFDVEKEEETQSVIA